MARFGFTAEPDPARNNWRVVCSRGADRFVMARGFPKEARARAWAHKLNVMAERSFPHPAVREEAEAWPESDPAAISQEPADGRPAD